MNGSYKSRLLIWSGPLFAIAFVVADLLLVGDGKGEKATGAEVVQYFEGRQGRTMVEIFAAPAVATLLVLFAGEFRRRAAAAGELRTAPTVMFAGAVVWVTSLVGGAAVDLALASSADNHQEQVAQTLNVLSNDSWIPLIAGVAIFLIGAGGTVLGSGLLPKWLGWVAVVGGVVSLAGPGGFIGFFLAPLWIIVAGAVLATRTDAAEPSTSTAAVLV
jgi:hypothetical protein